MDNPAEQPAVDLISIGEFADATGLSVSAVRFYTNRGVLHPADVDVRSGYRRFARDQIAEGQLIRALRQLEMPLTSIARALEMSADEQQALVQQHLDQLTANVGRVQSIAQSLGATRTHPKEHRSMNTAMRTNGSATLPARALGAALAQVLPVTGTDPEAPHLMTVLLEAKDGSVRVVGTDRHRLAVRDIVPTTIDADFRVVLAAATVAGWELDVDGDLTIAVDDTEVVLTDAFETQASSVPADYPDYQAVLDAPSGVTTITAQSAALTAGLAELSEPVVLDIAPAGLTVGDCDPIPTTHAGPPQQVLVNPSYLRDAVTATIGTEVVIDITTPLAPLVIRSADDGTFTTLVMPIAPQ